MGCAPSAVPPAQPTLVDDRHDRRRTCARGPDPAARRSPVAECRYRRRRATPGGAGANNGRGPPGRRDPGCAARRRTGRGHGLRHERARGDGARRDPRRGRGTQCRARRRAARIHRRPPGVRGSAPAPEGRPDHRRQPRRSDCGYQRGPGGGRCPRRPGRGADGEHGVTDREARVDHNRDRRDGPQLVSHGGLPLADRRGDRGRRGAHRRSRRGRPRQSSGPACVRDRARWAGSLGRRGGLHRFGTQGRARADRGRVGRRHPGRPRALSQDRGGDLAAVLIPGARDVPARPSAVARRAHRARAAARRPRRACRAVLARPAGAGRCRPGRAAAGSDHGLSDRRGLAGLPDARGQDPRRRRAVTPVTGRGAPGDGDAAPAADRTPGARPAHQPGPDSAGPAPLPRGGLARAAGRGGTPRSTPTRRAPPPSRRGGRDRAGCSPGA